LSRRRVTNKGVAAQQESQFALEIEPPPGELVAMIGSTATADAMPPVPEADESAGAAARVPAGYIDTGEPIEDLPPLIEPTGFAEMPVSVTAGQRAPRRNFLAPPVAKLLVDAPTKRASVPASGVPPTIPVEPKKTLVEPKAASSAPVAPNRLSLTRRWLTATTSRLPAGRWQRVALAAAVAIVLLAVIVGLGRFAGHPTFRASAPPPTNATQRLAYFEDGAKAGDANAELQLGIIYAKGEGVAQNYTTAANWFRAAANQGVARAQYDLGVLYERGRGVPVDLNEAAAWYLKAATAKHPLAQYNLAVCYTKGQGIRKDPTEAALWYRRAAGQGVVQAMVNLAMMYEKGEGVAVSPVDAYAWYRAAGQRDNPPAARRATEIYASLPQLDQIRAEALASDVNTSIEDPPPQSGEAAARKQDAKSAATDN
jgi:TPR repeat protein